jgi:acyl-coenzyme A thioesterase PaaI-like protein
MEAERGNGGRADEPRPARRAHVEHLHAERTVREVELRGGDDERLGCGARAVLLLDDPRDAGR